jgi:hypothetical protein
LYEFDLIKIFIRIIIKLKMDKNLTINKLNIVKELQNRFNEYIDESF